MDTTPVYMLRKMFAKNHVELVWCQQRIARHLSLGFNSKVIPVKAYYHGRFISCTITGRCNSGNDWKCFFSTEAFYLEILRVKPAPDHVLHWLAFDLTPSGGMLGLGS